MRHMICFEDSSGNDSAGIMDVSFNDSLDLSRMWEIPNHGHMG